MIFMVIVGLFTLGNSSDAFLVLRAQERGLSVLGVLGMLVTFNLIYTLISTPAGSLSDRIGRRKLIVGGWLVYAVIYLGFGLAQTGWQVWVLYALYGVYYGLAYGTAKALVADLVPETRARHGLRHVQRRPGHPGFSGLAHRRRAVAGRGRLARLRSVGAVHLRRRAGADRGGADGGVEAGCDE